MKASPSLGSSLSFMDESNRVISNDIGEAAANRALHCQKKRRLDKIWASWVCRASEPPSPQKQMRNTSHKSKHETPQASWQNRDLRIILSCNNKFTLHKRLTQGSLIMAVLS